MSSDGFALEGPRSALLWRIGDRLATTPIDGTGILASITQAAVYELAAAVSMKPDARGAIKKGSDEDKEMRLLVVGDSDLISDRVIRNPGNGYMAVDAVKWLGGEEKFIGEVSSEALLAQNDQQIDTLRSKVIRSLMNQHKIRFQDSRHFL